MYLTHFGLIHYPFERALQPDELFASSAAREAQARLNHLVELRGIGLITGEVGSGKTTVCRQLASALHPGLHRLFTVPITAVVSPSDGVVSYQAALDHHSPAVEHVQLDVAHLGLPYNGTVWSVIAEALQAMESGVGRA
jgi:MoxR-like ATPase